MVGFILSWKQRSVVRSFCSGLFLYRFEDALGAAIRERRPICLDECRTCTVAKKIRRSPGGHSRRGEKIAGAILGARSWRSVVRSCAHKVLDATSQSYPMQQGDTGQEETDRSQKIRKIGDSPWLNSRPASTDEFPSPCVPGWSRTAPKDFRHQQSRLCSSATIKLSAWSHKICSNRQCLAYRTQVFPRLR